MTRQKFFAECTPVGREFFQRVLDLATDSGARHQLEGEELLVRADIPGWDGLSTFLQCVPKTSYESETDLFYFVFGYLKNTLPPDETTALRQRLLESGVLSKASENALMARPTQENLEERMLPTT